MHVCTSKMATLSYHISAGRINIRFSMNIHAFYDHNHRLCIPSCKRCTHTL